MIMKGFKDVSQLDGGILKYLENTKKLIRYGRGMFCFRQ